MSDDLFIRTLRPADWLSERFPAVSDETAERIPLPVVAPKTVSYP